MNRSGRCCCSRSCFTDWGCWEKASWFNDSAEIWIKIPQHLGPPQQKAHKRLDHQPSMAIKVFPDTACQLRGLILSEKAKRHEQKNAKHFSGAISYERKLIKALKSSSCKCQFHLSLLDFQGSKSLFSLAWRQWTDNCNYFVTIVTFLRPQRSCQLKVHQWDRDRERQACERWERFIKININSHLQVNITLWIWLRQTDRRIMPVQQLKKSSRRDREMKGDQSASHSSPQNTKLKPRRREGNDFS